MDRKLKERLVGAAVLVVLGVWLIPWILDGPNPAPDADEEVVATLELPAPVAGQAETLRRETIELEVSPKAAQSEPETRSVESSGSAITTARVAEREPDAAAAARPEAKPPAPTPAASPPGRAAATTPPAAPAGQRSAEGSAEGSARGSGQDGWMVQLGSFGDEANARRQTDRIKTFGHQARIFPFTAGGRTMYRVRVGSFPTRNQAEATASALSAHGFPAQIVAPE